MEWGICMKYDRTPVLDEAVVNDWKDLKIWRNIYLKHKPQAI
jgi:hypothetical protein